VLPNQSANRVSANRPRTEFFAEEIKGVLANFQQPGREQRLKWSAKAPQFPGRFYGSPTRFDTDELGGGDS
jgi:hypothetical protein